VLWPISASEIQPPKKSSPERINSPTPCASLYYASHFQNGKKRYAPGFLELHCHHLICAVTNVCSNSKIQSYHGSRDINGLDWILQDFPKAAYRSPFEFPQTRSNWYVVGNTCGNPSILRARHTPITIDILTACLKQSTRKCYS
jgi:hypothetical protein